MRVNTYRAKCFITGEEIKGQLLTIQDHYFISQPDTKLKDLIGSFEEVKPDSLQQFTGFHDKNNNPIYEGDVLTETSKSDEGVFKYKLFVFFNEKIQCMCISEFNDQTKYKSFELLYELDFQNIEIKL